MNGYLNEVTYNNKTFKVGDEVVVTRAAASYEKDPLNQGFDCDVGWGALKGLAVGKKFKIVLINRSATGISARLTSDDPKLAGPSDLYYPLFVLDHVKEGSVKYPELKPYMRVSTASGGNWLVLPNHPSLGLYCKDDLILYNPGRRGWNSIDFAESTQEVGKKYNITAVYANTSNVMELLNPDAVGEKLWDRVEAAAKQEKLDRIALLAAEIGERQTELEQLKKEVV